MANDINAGQLCFGYSSAVFEFYFLNAYRIFISESYSLFEYVKHLVISTAMIILVPK